MYFDSIADLIHLKKSNLSKKNIKGNKNNVLATNMTKDPLPQTNSPIELVKKNRTCPIDHRQTHSTECRSIWTGQDDHTGASSSW